MKSKDVLHKLEQLTNMALELLSDAQSNGLCEAWIDEAKYAIEDLEGQLPDEDMFDSEGNYIEED